MKFCQLFLALLLILPAAHAAENISNLYKKLESSFSPEVMACKAQQRNMDSAYKILERPNSSGVKVDFTQDEKKILQILTAFRAQDIVAPKHQNHFRNLIFSICTEENLERYAELEKARVRCDSSYSQLNFMQGLAHALKQNDWSVATQALAKEKMISYLMHMSELRTFLSHRIIALSILNEMLSNGIISNTNASKIKEAKSRAEIYSINLADEQKIRTSFSANCPKFKEAVLKELSFADNINDEIKSILRKL